MVPEGPTQDHALTAMLVRDGVPYCAGTFVGSDRILTAAHCLQGGIPAHIVTRGGRRALASVECADFGPDVALLRTTIEVARYARIDRNPAEVGDAVRGIGAPNGRAWGYFEGQILAIKRNRFAILAPVQPGHSGGGIFRGDLLLGVITHYSPEATFGLAVSASEAEVCGMVRH